MKGQGERSKSNGLKLKSSEIKIEIKIENKKMYYRKEIKLK